jgi:hypothetical protein
VVVASEVPSPANLNRTLTRIDQADPTQSESDLGAPLP